MVDFEAVRSSSQPPMAKASRAFGTGATSAWPEASMLDFGVMRSPPSLATATASSARVEGVTAMRAPPPPLKAKACGGVSPEWSEPSMVYFAPDSLASSSTDPWPAESMVRLQGVSLAPAQHPQFVAQGATPGQWPQPSMLSFASASSSNSAYDGTGHRLRPLPAPKAKSFLDDVPREGATPLVDSVCSARYCYCADPIDSLQVRHLDVGDNPQFERTANMSCIWDVVGKPIVAIRCAIYGDSCPWGGNSGFVAYYHKDCVGSMQWYNSLLWHRSTGKSKKNYYCRGCWPP